MEALIEHKCPVNGLMSIEKDKPCNYCAEFDKEPVSQIKRGELLPLTTRRL